LQYGTDPVHPSQLRNQRYQILKIGIMEMKYEDRITKQIRESLEVKDKMLHSGSLIQGIDRVVSMIVNCYHDHGKVLFCGNGGSAADAQHLSAELSGRFRKNRPPLFAEALHVNTSFLTAVGNDFGYDQVFARMLEAMGKQGDILVAISTSGNSPNVVAAARQAQKMGIIVVGLTGGDGGELSNLCTVELKIPSRDTARIQEGHILTGHIVCELVEAELFPDA